MSSTTSGDGNNLSGRPNGIGVGGIGSGIGGIGIGVGGIGSGVGGIGSGAGGFRSGIGGDIANKPKQLFQFSNKDLTVQQNLPSSSSSSSAISSTFSNRQGNAKTNSKVVSKKKRISVEDIIDHVFLLPGNQARLIQNIQRVYNSRWGKFFTTKLGESVTRENNVSFRKGLEITFGPAGVLLNSFIGKLYWVSK
jgi:hypothetical protein